MKAYVLGNRQRARRLVGEPPPQPFVALGGFTSPITFPVFRGFVELVVGPYTPPWIAPASFAALNSLSALAYSSGSRGAFARINTPAGVIDAASGVMLAIRGDDPSAPYSGSAQAIEIPQGRHLPGVVADCRLVPALFGPKDYAAFQSVGDGYEAVTLEHAGCLVCFLEKTPQGYGHRFVRVALRTIEKGQDEHDLIARCSAILTVSLVNESSETVAHSAVVAGDSGEDSSQWNSRVRVALGRDENDNDCLFVSYALFGSFGMQFVHTATIPYSRPSEDATIFAGMREPSGVIAPPLLPPPLALFYERYQSRVFSVHDGIERDKGLPLVAVDHDTQVDIAFSCGATAMPDINNGRWISTRRDEIEVSELPARVVTANVRCGPTVEFPVPEAEGELTQQAPILERRELQDATFELYANGRDVVKAKTLATMAHVFDASLLAHHATVLHSLPDDQCMHLLGKKVESATITLTIKIPAENPPETIPRGEFNCQPFSVGSAESAAGILKGSSEAYEVAAVFSVLLQEAGVAEENVNSFVGYAQFNWQSQANPIGRILPAVFFVPPLGPSPALALELHARKSGEPALAPIGRFIFDKSETAALMSGAEVVKEWDVFGAPIFRFDVKVRLNVS